MSTLWIFVQAYLDSQGGMSSAALARKIGSTPQTLNTWKIRGSRPGPEILRSLAVAIDIDHEVLLAAVEADDGYRTDDELMTVLRDRKLSAEHWERLRRHVSAPTREDRDQRRKSQP